MSQPDYAALAEIAADPEFQLERRRISDEATAGVACRTCGNVGAFGVSFQFGTLAPNRPMFCERCGGLNYLDVPSTIPATPPPEVPHGPLG